MPRTVYEGFAELLERIEPRPAEVKARQAHRRSIEQALGAAFDKFNRLEVMGSHTRGTAIRYHSDVDYLAVLGREDVTRGGSWLQSSTVLTKVRRALVERFPNTDMRGDGPSVVVKFQGGEGAVDVVPGFYRGPTGNDGYPMFAIPDGNGGWFDTSPQRHGKFLKEKNEASGHKLFRVVRFLKAWKYARTPHVPFLSFHVELLLAAEGTCEGVKSYAECLQDAFWLLGARGGRALNDPLGISGRIPIVYTEAKERDLVKHAEHALQHADAALQAEEFGKLDEAYRQWRIVFNEEFPARR